MIPRPLRSVQVVVRSEPGPGVAFDPLLAMPVIATWLIIELFHRLFAVPAALITLIVLVFWRVGIGGLAEGELSATLWSAPVLVIPRLDIQSSTGVALPLFVVTMASQNIPWIAVLKVNGFQQTSGQSRCVPMSGLSRCVQMAGQRRRVPMSGLSRCFQTSGLPSFASIDRHAAPTPATSCPSAFKSRNFLIRATLACACARLRSSAMMPDAAWPRSIASCVMRSRLKPPSCNNRWQLEHTEAPLVRVERPPCSRCLT